LELPHADSAVQVLVHPAKQNLEFEACVFDITVGKEILDIPLVDVALSFGIKSVEQGGWGKVWLLGQHLFDGFELLLQFGCENEHLHEFAACEFRLHCHRI
jgi:hypothetical protein